MFNEFLVLGRVPGTSFEITFSEILLVLDIGLVMILLYRRREYFVKLKDRIYYFRLYLSVKHGQQLSLPV